MILNNEAKMISTSCTMQVRPSFFLHPLCFGGDFFFEFCFSVLTLLAVLAEPSILKDGHDLLIANQDDPTKQSIARIFHLDQLETGVIYLTQKKVTLLRFNATEGKIHLAHYTT